MLPSCIIELLHPLALHSPASPAQTVKTGFFLPYGQTPTAAVKGFQALQRELFFHSSTVSRIHKLYVLATFKLWKKT